VRRQLLVTADDFGSDPAVNDAVETAHREGILTAASLMVAAPAAADAVARARRLPELRVGLHLAVVHAVPVLPPAEIPRLVGPESRLRSDLFRAGVDYRFRRETRAQLRREIRAQFEAFAATELGLDHANAHKHMHLHPTVAALMLEIGREFGLRAVRWPMEPAAPLRRVDPRARPQRWLGPWQRRLRNRLREGGILTNDRVFGIAWSGRMTEERVVRLLPEIPEGVSEIYFHPTTEGDAAELAALTSGTVRAEIDRCGFEMTSFGELAARVDTDGGS
jgi:hopanoid biosynthesis associated protein HpnK